ncbi:hypothetical protein SLEP1_g38008 [Rubroshorea leprosula]|uniref:Uncharacterized protein n=1 Tax=Rubroshorea leprosula TaxID=152421 RepID=A0AAV5KWH2_9ROSI|nr:hypothetical protein SLEP1_g38008 [Rubroshorea leprosula]
MNPIFVSFHDIPVHSVQNSSRELALKVKGYKIPASTAYALQAAEKRNPLFYKFGQYSRSCR